MGRLRTKATVRKSRLTFARVLASRQERTKKNTTSGGPHSRNRRATFDYAIEETYEGGLSLVGSEVKSVRAGKVEMVDAYCSVDNGELYLKQMYIAPFEQAKAFPHEPRRDREKCFSTRMKSRSWTRRSRAKGYTLVPLRLYLVKGRVKVEIGVAKGKKQHDKRASIRAKTADREARAEVTRARKR